MSRMRPEKNLHKSIQKAGSLCVVHGEQPKALADKLTHGGTLSKLSVFNANLGDAVIQAPRRDVGRISSQATPVPGVD